MRVFYDHINNYSKEEYDEFLKKIHTKKQEKIAKLLRNEDQYRSILGERLLMRALSEIGIDYDSIHISTNIYGKPYIQDHALFFSISHSNDYVICSLSDKEIGIDIEKIRHVDYNVLRMFATFNEIQYIVSDDFLYDQRSFEIFTLKEAYCKYLGISLSNVLTIEFNINNDIIQCSDDHCTFQLLDDIDGYVIAICEMKD